MLLSGVEWTQLCSHLNCGYYVYVYIYELARVKDWIKMLKTLNCFDRHSCRHAVKANLFTWAKRWSVEILLFIGLHCSETYF